MENKAGLICHCGKLVPLELDEEMNYKDRVFCGCGREYVVVELT